MRDLVLTDGCIIDPATGRDETADIAFGDQRSTILPSFESRRPDRGSQVRRGLAAGGESHERTGL